MTQIYKTGDVFVPGGMPELTYVARSPRNLEQRLCAAKDNLCKLVTVTGATKSGKTVLVSRVFPKPDAIWIQGGTIGREDDLWGYILAEIDGYTETDTAEQKAGNTEIAGNINLKPLPLFPNFGLEGKISHTTKKESSRKRTLTLTSRAAAIKQLDDKKVPVIIDDFHYLPRDFQGKIIRALKQLIFNGLPVILIVIPHRRYDAIKVEREMTGRLETIDIPTWDKNELLEIPNAGFPKLNVEVSTGIANRLADEAYGSPHLMQEFCRKLAEANRIAATLERRGTIIHLSDDLFKNVASGTGKVMFDKLAKGPRQRTDRISRKLKDGNTTDIYGVILQALASLKPGLATVEYEQLRAAIREILADAPPRAHEVTRVLEQMAKIASQDESSTPVVDWEKEERKLHITDPFFAFYLKWGYEISSSTAV